MERKWRRKRGGTVPGQVASVGLPPPLLVRVVAAAVAHARHLLRQELALRLVVQRRLLAGRIERPTPPVQVAPGNGSGIGLGQRRRRLLLGLLLLLPFSILDELQLFVLLVNDRKFPARNCVFLSHQISQQ